MGRGQKGDGAPRGGGSGDASATERDRWRRINRPDDCASYKRTVHPFGLTRGIDGPTLLFGHASAGHTATRFDSRLAPCVARDRDALTRSGDTRAAAVSRVFAWAEPRCLYAA
jgi:hypothetical protein